MLRARFWGGSFLNVPSPELQNAPFVDILDRSSPDPCQTSTHHGTDCKPINLRIELDGPFWRNAGTSACAKLSATLTVYNRPTSTILREHSYDFFFRRRAASFDQIVWIVGLDGRHARRPSLGRPF